MSPHKIALIIGLILLSGFTADLLFVRKIYELKHGINGWAAIRRWARRSIWHSYGCCAAPT